MPHSDANAISWRGMDDVDFAERLNMAPFDSNRIFGIDSMSLGTVASGWCDDHHITQRQQRLIQCGQSWSVKSIVVGNQKSHVVLALLSREECKANCRILKNPATIQIETTGS